MGRRLDDSGETVDLEVIDWAAAAQRLLSIDAVTFVSVEGSAVPQLRRQLADDRVRNAVGEATIFATLKTQVATFRKTPAVVEALLPHLGIDDWKVYHLNLHDEHCWLVQGYDWSAGCCPVRVAVELRQVAEELIAAGIAKPWPEDEGV